MKDKSVSEMTEEEFDSMIDEVVVPSEVELKIELLDLVNSMESRIDIDKIVDILMEEAIINRSRKTLALAMGI